MRRIFPALLLAGCLLAPAAGSLADQIRPLDRRVMATVPLSRMNLSGWRERHEQILRRVAQGDVGLIWLGDSITQNWERTGPPSWADFLPVWNHFYGDRKAVNMGFGGDTTASLLWRIQNGEVNGIAPRVAVILIGANNFGRVHWGAADTLAGIEAIITELQRRLPRTKLLLLSVLPSERSPWVTENTVTVNNLLADKYGHGGPVAFVDVTGLFFRDGPLDRSMFYDQYLTPPDPLLHPSAQAQEKIAKAIEPTLASMMGDRPH